MSTKQKDRGGPAFPVPEDNEEYGMWLRDWFAGLAMQALLSNSNNEVVDGFSKHGEAMGQAIAESAYAFADDMIKVRKS